MRELTFYITFTHERSGTHFLISLLSNSGIGAPGHNICRVAAGYKKANPSDSINDLEKLYADGRRNNIWGGFLHWYQFAEGVKGLRKLAGLKENTDSYEVLNTVFPGVKFIYLYRLHKIKQAISLTKRKQSDFWNSELEKPFDYQYASSEVISNLFEILRDDSKILDFFQRYNIKPHYLTYESLCQNTVEQIENIIKFLGVQLPGNITIEECIHNARLPTRQYNAHSEEWYQRFLKESLSTL